MTDQQIVECAALLAGFLNDDCLVKLLCLDENDFIELNHQKIFKALKKFKSGFDIHTIRQETGIDYVYLAEFLNSYCITGFQDSYISEILDMSKKRQLARLYEGASEATGKLHSADHIINIVDEIQKKLRSTDKKLSRVADSGVDEIKKVYDYISTGFEPLDNYIHGFYADELIILASRPSIGKSALALFLADKISKTKKVIYYSLEMTKLQLAQRIVTCNTGVPLWKIRKGFLDLEDNTAIDKYWAQFKSENRQLYINDQIFKLEDILASCESTGKPDIIFVDYIQLLLSDMREKRYIQVGDQSRALKELSKKLHCPVVALCQLNRQSELRKDQMPELSDLRESGSLEADADVVL